MPKILVVGGAGYVGSATCAHLLQQGHEVWILDNLSTGRHELILGTHFIYGQAGDRKLLTPLLTRERFDCVMHFAARSLVPESIEKPDEYFENNVTQTTSLLEAMVATDTTRFIFSSTCAIFGNPGHEVISESLPQNPIHPYGATKLEVERRLAAFSTDRGLEAIALRYFNAAGAESQNRVGEWHTPESHLIPRVLQAIQENREIEIFGTDYPTPDGTCIRDYIHVSDLAVAHEAAMTRLLKGNRTKNFEAFNLGSEKGFSVREVISACERATKRKAQIIEKPRRPGDPPRLVADSGLAKRVLGFNASRNLEDTVASAWAWELKKKAHPQTLKRAVFLDRDGTLNEDPGYIGNPDDLKLLPAVGEALQLLQSKGFQLIIVSNQSGIGRGLFTEEQLKKVHARLDELLASHGVKIDRYQLCFHKPEDACSCRKPSPQLLFDAARLMNLDLGHSYMIGDKNIDLKTGKSSGCSASLLVRTGYGRESEANLKDGDADFVADTLLDAAQWIVKSGARVET